MIYGEADTEDVQVDKVAQKQEELTQVHEEVEIAEEIEEEQEKSSENVLTYTEPITVEELAEKLEKDVAEIIKNLMFLGVMATKNQNLDDTDVELICEENGYKDQKDIKYINKKK